MAKRNTAKKTAQRKNLYLILTIAFFLAIIAIFVFDGYMGIYDTVTITAAEREDVIEPDSWMRGDYSYYTWVEEGQDINFVYELDNRRFSTYSADVEAAIWFGESKHSDLISQAVAIGSFDKEELAWTIDTTLLRPADIAETQDYEFSVIITRDGVERRIVVHVSSLRPVPSAQIPITLETVKI
ncbi:MAG TPA: hypothetical protein VMW60_03675 [Dehalococcoidales bacterium]|nr:hypothetical protein [Dehalococcoidales bacterium]